jgi:hypothetical protein
LSLICAIFGVAIDEDRVKIAQFGFKYPTTIVQSIAENSEAPCYARFKFSSHVFAKGYLEEWKEISELECMEGLYK